MYCLIVFQDKDCTLFKVPKSQIERGKQSWEMFRTFFISAFFLVDLGLTRIIVPIIPLTDLGKEVTFYLNWLIDYFTSWIGFPKKWDIFVIA